jgi:hypothetical protein
MQNTVWYCLQSGVQNERWDSEGCWRYNKLTFWWCLYSRYLHSACILYLQLRCCLYISSTLQGYKLTFITMQRLSRLGPGWRYDINFIDQSKYFTSSLYPFQGIQTAFIITFQGIMMKNQNVTSNVKQPALLIAIQLWTCWARTFLFMESLCTFGYKQKIHVRHATVSTFLCY